jgi:anti-sigma factor RsiW
VNPGSGHHLAGLFPPLPRAAVEAFTETDETAPRHVIHLPMAVPDLTGGLDLARTLARSLAWMPEIDAAGTTVSAEDSQHVRHWVFCDRIMPDRRRCLLRADHRGQCLPTDP